MMKVKSIAARGAVFAALSLCVLSLAVALPSGARERRAPVRRDTAALRRALAAALGGEFEIVRDEVTRRSNYHGGGAFWLVHVRPKRSGRFSLKYTYEYVDPFRTDEPRETRVEHTIPLGVGPRGCWRRPEYMASSYHPCLGDTVILPFALDAYKKVYEGHAFAFTVHSVAPPGAGAGPEKWEEALTREQEAGLRRDSVANPVAEHLKYLGSAAHVMPHRSSGFTAEYHATFEALKPGRFNLLLGVSEQEVSELGSGRAGGVPVIVVERGAPVTWLAAREEVSDYVGRFSAHAGNSYLTTPVVMQPGERLTLRYGGFTRRGFRAETDREGSIEERHLPPSITRLPFRVDPDDSFNEWIVNHLPG